MRDDLLLCISIPLKCGPQAPTVAFGVAYRLYTRRPGYVVHPLPSGKVTAATTQQWSLREKNGGINLAAMCDCDATDVTPC